MTNSNQGMGDILQYSLVCIQIIIAVISIVFLRKYHKGALVQSAKSNSTQMQSLQLQLSQDNEIKLKVAIELRERIEGSALEGIKGDKFLPAGQLSKKSEDGLSLAKKDLVKMQRTAAGLPYQRTIEPEITKLISLINEYLSIPPGSDPHDHRAKIYARISRQANHFEQTWQSIARSRIDEINK
ncbi:MAG: hypothetical protein KDC26_05460 [Armatimonadetes bacterium]|nr:hypothetical protein [Armatimonadota bacterium]